MIVRPNLICLRKERTIMAPRKTKSQLDMFGDKAPEGNGSAYQPLPSVWDGTDAELLDRMLNFYPRKRPKRILDATVNKGRFWRGLSWKIVGMDIEPSCCPD